jgi:glycosyltransferase involved in cell wall biosynthesis
LFFFDVVIVYSIVFITTHAPSLINFRAPLIKSLLGKGVEVFAFAPNFDEKTRIAVRGLGAIPVDCPISRTGMNPLLDAINTWKMARLLRRVKPDITLGYFIKPVIYGSIAARLAGVPRRYAMVEGLGFVFTPAINALPFKRRFLKQLVLHLYRLGLSCAHRVIFLNPDDRAELSAAGVVPVGKTFLLGGIGVELDKWPLSPPVVSPVTFLLVARLLREKGVEEYAAAAHLVKQRYPDARFILLGGIDENPGSITTNDVKAWVDEGILEWHGHVAVQPWMKQTSVFVLPSYYREGVPASTQEAMAMGRAVITTDAPGCRETVVEGVNGFLVPARNTLALAEKMFTFIEQPALIESMGRESRRLAEERFDVHKVNQRLIDLILAPQQPGA